MANPEPGPAPPVSRPILTLPNQLTLLRMGLAPALLALVLSDEMGWALAVFVIAGITDLLDGFIARVGHQQTQLGALLDPLADKILLSASFAVLTWARGLTVAIPAWLTVVVLARDVIMLASTTVVAITLGTRQFPPSWLGKATTATQLVTVGLVLALNAVGWAPGWMRPVFKLNLLLTVVSALHYVWRGSRHHGPPPGE